MEIRHEKIFIVITIVLIALGVLYWYWTELVPGSRGPTVIPSGTAVQEDMITKQLQELDALRAQLPQSGKTPEEQVKELNAIYKKSGLKPPSEAEISRQLEELEKLRGSQ